MQNLNLSANYDITIVTVSYNSYEEIRPTVENIMEFLSEEIEYLIIDGGSTDKSIEYFDSLKERKHFRYISEKDDGIYNAMNKAKQLARGRWIWFINAGDKVITIPNLKNMNKYSIVCFAVETEEGIELPRFGSALRLRNTLPHQGMFYKKEDFKGFDERFKIFGDYAYNLQRLNDEETIHTDEKVVSFHSLVGLSNDKTHANELKTVLKKYNPVPYYLLSQIYFKIRGLVKRLNRFI